MSENKRSIRTRFSSMSKGWSNKCWPDCRYISLKFFTKFIFFHQYYPHNLATDEMSRRSSDSICRPSRTFLVYIININLLTCKTSQRINNFINTSNAFYNRRFKSLILNIHMTHAQKKNDYPFISHIRSSRTRFPVRFWSPKMIQ